MYRHHNNWQEWILKEHFKFSYFTNTNSIVDVKVPLLTESLNENQIDDVDYNVFLKSRLALKISQTKISKILSDILNLLNLNSNIKLDNFSF